MYSFRAHVALLHLRRSPGYIRQLSDVRYGAMQPLARRHRTIIAIRTVLQAGGPSRESPQAETCEREGLHH